MNIVNTLFSVNSLNFEAQRFILKAFTAIFIFTFIIMSSQTFIILYALEFVTPAELGQIIAVQFLLTAVTDYPTGTLGDYIGQKAILIIATIIYIFGFLSLAISNDFGSILISFIIIGLAQGQESGSFIAWFDNNYKLYAPEDKSKRLYSSMFGKFQMVLQLVTASGFILGGFVVSIIGRSATFFYQSLALILVILIFMILLQNHPSLKRKNKNQQEDKQGLISLMKESLIICWKRKELRYFIIGTIFEGIALSFWMQLMLFPFYADYAKTDDVIGLLRATIFVLSALLLGIGGSFSKHILKTKRWLFISIILMDLMFFGGILFILIFNPPLETFSAEVLYIMIFLLAIIFIPRTIKTILMPRFLLDAIPDKHRNSIYSLLPTLVLVFSIPLMVFGGQLLDEVGSQSVLVLLTLLSFIGGLFMAYSVYIHKFLLSDEELSKISAKLYLKNFDLQVPSCTRAKLPPSWDTFKKSIAKLWDDLAKTAMADNVITEPESKLIEKIIIKSKSYSAALEFALEDSIISIDEKKNLDNLLKSIYNIVFQEAKSDGIVDEDEIQLLNIFKTYLDKWQATF